MVGMMQVTSTRLHSTMAKNKKLAKDTRALSQPQTAELGWIQGEFQEHPVIGLTPQKLHRVLLEAEHGNLTAQADLFSDMEERDGHIFSEMSKRTGAVSSLPWTIEPPKRADAKESKIAEQINEIVDEIQALETVFLNACSATGHGFAGQTIGWEFVEGLHMPVNFDFALQRDFQTPFNQPNELRLRDGSAEGAELWQHGWFMHKHNARAGYISRAGLFRVLTWPFLFKNYSTRDLAELLHIYGLPIRIGEYPLGATDAEKMKLLQAVMSVGRSAGGIIPKGMKIDFQDAADGTADPHMAMIKWCELTQSKIIVGGTLLSQADGKTSTNALGSVHENGFNQLVKSDALALARSFNDSVIHSIMQLNFPDIDPRRYPKLYFDTTDIADIKVLADSIPKLVDVGLPVSIPHVLKKLGMPQPKEGEPILARAQTQQPAIAANSQRFGGFKLAALAQQVQQSVYPDQQALDAAIDQLEVGELHAQAQAIIQPILKKLESAKTPDEALGMLADIAPDSSPDRLQEYLARLLFAADTWGAINAQAELKDDA